MAQETYTQSGPSGGERAYAYALVGANLVLYPSPPAGQTYQHHYVPQPADLSAASGSTNVDVVTPKGEDMVIWGVAVMARAKQDLPAVLHQAKYEEARRHVEEWATLRNLHETKRRVIDDGWGANPLYRRW
jgi:hypothetical protein